MRQHEPNTNFTPKLSHGNAHLVPQNESLGPTSAAHECTHRALGSHRSFGFSTEGCRHHSWLHVLDLRWRNLVCCEESAVSLEKLGAYRNCDPVQNLVRFATAHRQLLVRIRRAWKAPRDGVSHVKHLQTKKARRTINLLPICQIRSTHLHLSLPSHHTSSQSKKK